MSGEFSVGGVKLTKALLTNPQALDAYSKLGIDVMTFSFGGSYHWDTDRKTAMLKDFDVKIDELGGLNLSADLSGIEKPATLLQTAMLTHAVLRYADASLADRAIKLAAARTGADPAQFRQKISLVLPALAAQFGTGPVVATGTKAIVAFLADPHSLTIELAPPQPVALAGLAADRLLPLEQILTKFGVTVTAN